MSNIALSSARTLALATLIGGLAVGSASATTSTNITHGAPSSAISPNTTMAQSDEDMSGSPSSTPSATKISQSMSNHVEQRIKTLHDKLKITSDQESEWGDVAQAMRDNETALSQLIAERHQNAGTQNAVEDLQSYQKITQAHADGLGKLIPAFETLYNDMSDSQKKNADQVFGQFEGARGAAVKHVSKKSSK
jgi:hypothetical protein